MDYSNQVSIAQTRPMDVIRQRRNTVCITVECYNTVSSCQNSEQKCANTLHYISTYYTPITILTVKQSITDFTTGTELVLLAGHFQC